MQMLQTTDPVEGGFDNIPTQSAHAFRAAMTAMARPGTAHVLSGATAPAPTSPAAATLLMTLLDPETPLFLAPGHDTGALRDWIAFHIGAPLVGPERAVFALGAWDALTPITRFAAGTPEYPDRAATLIVDDAASGWDAAILTGPGILNEAVADLPDIDILARNAALFPLGLDFFFTRGDRVQALPRSIKVRAR
ncbi:phosphonate C-P lyase system protein PhnH [Shimia biformata]|uniref:phosphonate C-P lyase system protein PhnH n=1 Tax=Shimia biformata TaxID=1294299 RepID=UPI001EF221C3|nr:phosphonate C-P lyase system protein PhnH [Shimia biformata]